MKTLRAKIGQLTVENNFLESALAKVGLLSVKRCLTVTTHFLAAVRPSWPALAGQRVYYLPKQVSSTELALMPRIDALHQEHPFMGARMLRDQLSRDGVAVGRRHVGTLMKRMGVKALYKKTGD